ncbi:MAG: nucleotidyl transferase AbiEii/AbiGii toxin family protein, partial [Burkholderiales bacterium]|nr:nucleotidyl transferase AbiEii/AbiGii toxin family protein [Burkholderiales bacterium]
IGRFSEDIDLILDWNTVVQDNPMLGRSKTKQVEFNHELNQSAHKFLISDLLPKFKNLLKPLCNCELNQDTDLVINVNYPDIFHDNYLRPQILLEIGPLAAWLPFNQYSITSFAAECFPNVFNQSKYNVKAILAERTFWEKATILHHEANRPEESKLPLRYSRHYYDLAMLALSNIKDAALGQLKLLKDVVEFKQKFYPRTWAKYDECLIGKLKLTPPDYRVFGLNADYKQMRTMIFGDYPEFNEILSILHELENEVNRLSKI